MSSFNYCGKRLFFSEMGKGPILMLLHGNTASSKMMHGIAQRFSDQYRVVLLDFLGYGQSDRRDEVPDHLWYDEAMQVIALIKDMGYEHVSIIGSSGGALAALNAALEAPELISHVVADSFEGAYALETFTRRILEERTAAKQDAKARAFFEYMHGTDWESVVDTDTSAILGHQQAIGTFFRKGFHTLKPEILLTGSLEDAYMMLDGPDAMVKRYRNMLDEIGHGCMHIFDHGGHPAMLSNEEEFVCLVKRFLSGNDAA